MPKDKRRSSRSPSRRKRSRSRSPRRYRKEYKYDEKESCETIHATKVKKEFSFEDYVKDLDTLFFTDRDVIKKGTPQYDEFWKFFNKYQMMRNRQGITTWIAPKSKPTNELGIPTVYHRSFLINFGLNLPPPDKLLDRLPATNFERKSYRPKLTKEQLMEFHQIILLYLEFLQREKMVKLKKLRESQEKLPIAQFKDEIIKTVSEQQIIIIAGMIFMVIKVNNNFMSRLFLNFRRYWLW